MPADGAAIADALAAHAVPWFFTGLAGVLVSIAGGWAGLRHMRLRRETSVLDPLPFLVAHLTAGFAIVVLAAAVFAAMTLALDAGAPIARFDSRLAASLARQASPAVLGFFAKATHGGDEATLVAVTIAVALLLVIWGRRWLAVEWFAACAGNAVLNPSLKQLFVRIRPLHDSAYAPTSEYSFPSGHSSGSVVVYGMLAYLLTRLLPARWHLPVMLVAAALVYTIACSRVVLRVHWASDVLAGLASGSAWLTVAIVSIQAMRHYRQSRV